MRVFADVGSRLIGAWDLDRAQLAALSSVQRRSGLGVAASAPAGGESRSRWLTPWFYFKLALLAVLGLAAAAGFQFQSFFFGLVFSYTLIMLMFGSTLLSYFATVLLSTAENRILLHLPISGRTLLAARILCIAKYAGPLALSVSLPTAVILAVRFGAVALLVFVTSLVLTLLLIIAVTLAACLFALRYVNPARIRQGILYFESALFVLAIYAGSVVLNANEPLVETVAGVFGEAWWYFYPPGWMAGLLDYSLMERTPFNGVLASTAVFAPLAAFVGCIRLFGGGRFIALLSRLEVVPRSSVVLRKSLPRWLARLSEQLSVLISRDRQQRAVLDLTSTLMKNDLTLNLTAYPYIGVILLNIGFVVVEFHDSPMQNPPLTDAFVLFTYCYFPMILAIIAPWIQYSAEWRSAWCYQILPFSRPGLIVSGAMKAYIRKYIVPVYLLLVTMSAAVWGTATALDALFAGAAATLVCVYSFWSVGPVPPYSKDRASHVTKKGGWVRRLAVPMALGLIVTHAVLKPIAGSWGVGGGIVAMSGAIIVAYRMLWFMGPDDVEAPDRHVGWEASPVKQTLEK